MTSIASLYESHATLAITRTMEVRREEYLDYMTFVENRHPLFTEIFGPLIGVKEEWAAQGATAEELNFSAFRYRQAMSGVIPVSAGGWIGDAGSEILEETDAHIIARDHFGRRVKLCKGVATLPLPLEYPVESMDDWLRLKHHYAFSEERFAPGWAETAREMVAQGQVVTVGIPGGFDEPRQLLGEEVLCIAYYEQSELIHDILNTIADTAYQVLDRVTAEVQVDQIFVHEDLAGKSGPLVGPEQVRTFMAPYFRRMWDLASSRGSRLFAMDSDGNIEAILPDLLEAGINVIFPMEPAAGMDIVSAREQYGTRLAFIGGIDKHVLRRSQEEITAELEYKLPPLIRTGGCVFGLDHRIPNGTPLENYRFYVRKVWEILERESAAQP
jgi:uroporphyrinogen-III decarboxylase